MDWNYSKTWYHGSPFQLTTLHKGSTITQDLELARVFSHKPTIVSISDDGRIKHNGATSGFLYCIAEEIQPDDVCPHPRTSMEPGREWLTNRELRLRLMGATHLVVEEKLTEEAITELQRRAKAGDG